MNDDDQHKLKAIVARCPELEVATGHVWSFAAMMAIRSSSRLPEWIAAARADVNHGPRTGGDRRLFGYALAYASTPPGPGPPHRSTFAALGGCGESAPPSRPWTRGWSTLNDIAVVISLRG
jgi:hypothetical protein